MVNFEATLRALDLEPEYFWREFRKGVRSNDAFVVALHLGCLGFHVFPATAGKTPLCDWDREATCKAKRIFGLQRRAKLIIGDSVNWCVRTGRDFGLWVIDVDGPRGRERLSELPPLPDTVTVTTGRPDGGTHYWFMPTPEGPDLKTVGHALIGGKRAPVDQKGRGGYAVIPGSIHASGARYRFLEGHALVTQLPPEWLEILDWADTQRASTGTKLWTRAQRGIRVKQSHDPGSRLFGDGAGHGGFQNPAYLNSIDFFFRAGSDAPADAIIPALRRMIGRAPKDHGRSVERYLCGPDLPRIVERARAFVKSVKDKNESES